MTREIIRSGKEERVAIGRGPRDGFRQARLPPAPDRFSTKNCWPKRSVNH